MAEKSMAVSKSDMDLLHKLEQFVTNPLQHKSISNLRVFLAELCEIQEKNNTSVQTLYLKSEKCCANVSQFIDEKDHVILWSAMLQLHCCFENYDQMDFNFEKILKYVTSYGLSVFVHGEKDQYYAFIKSLHDYAFVKSESKMKEKEGIEIFHKVEQILENIDITSKFQWIKSMFERLINSNLSFTAIYKSRIEQVYVHTFKIRICVYLGKLHQAVKILKKVLKMVDWNDAAFPILAYLVGTLQISGDATLNASASWLRKIIQNENLWFLKINHKLTPIKMEFKLRSLFKLGIIHFHQNEFKEAELMLGEFCASVEIFKPKLDNPLEYPLDGLLDLIQMIDYDVKLARAVLEKISRIGDLATTPNPPKETCDLIKRFQAERIFYYFTEFADSMSLDEKVENVKKCLSFQKGTCYENTYIVRQLQLNFVDHLANSNRCYEAMQEFEKFQEVFLSDHMSTIQNNLLDDKESQATAKICFYNTFDNVDQCLKKFHMDEDRKDFAEIYGKKLIDYSHVTSMRLEIDVLTNIYLASYAIKDFKACLKHLNLAQTFIQKKRRMFMEIRDTNGKRHHPDLKMAEITITKAFVEFMKIKFIKGSNERYKKIMSRLPLKYDCKDSQQLDIYENYINRIVCFYELRQYEDAKVLLERAHEIIPTSKTSLPRFHETFYIVAKILLDLKSGVIQNPRLADEWKLPLHFEGTLHGFKTFNSPPKYSYEYLNKQSNHSKTPDSAAEKSTLRKWRMFKNSALIIGKARHMVEMDRMKF